MGRLLRNHWLVGAQLIIACSGRGLAQSGRSDESTARRTASLYAGCYRLSDSTSTYVVRLDMRRAAKQWKAQLIRPLTANRGGDSWSWVPVDSSHFRIEWDGVDGSMEYAVTRAGDGFRTVHSIYSVAAPKVTRLPARALRVECDAPSS